MDEAPSTGPGPVHPRAEPVRRPAARRHVATRTRRALGASAVAATAGLLVGFTLTAPAAEVQATATDGTSAVAPTSTPTTTGSSSRSTTATTTTPATTPTTRATTPTTRATTPTTTHTTSHAS